MGSVATRGMLESDPTGGFHVPSQHSATTVPLMRPGDKKHRHREPRGGLGGVAIQCSGRGSSLRASSGCAADRAVVPVPATVKLQANKP